MKTGQSSNGSHDREASFCNTMLNSWIGNIGSKLDMCDYKGKAEIFLLQYTMLFYNRLVSAADMTANILLSVHNVFYGNTWNV